MATVAMAWVLRNPVVDAPIIGATKDHHLTDAVAALDLELTEEPEGWSGSKAEKDAEEDEEDDEDWDDDEDDDDDDDLDDEDDEDHEEY